MRLVILFNFISMCLNVIVCCVVLFYNKTVSKNTHKVNNPAEKQKENEVIVKAAVCKPH